VSPLRVYRRSRIFPIEEIGRTCIRRKIGDYIYLVRGPKKSRRRKTELKVSETFPQGQDNHFLLQGPSKCPEMLSHTRSGTPLHALPWAPRRSASLPSLWHTRRHAGPLFTRRVGDRSFLESAKKEFRDPKFPFLSGCKTCLYKYGELGIFNQFSLFVSLHVTLHIAHAPSALV